MGTAVPGVTACGTTAFTWNNPATAFPAEPANCTKASWPPIATFTGSSGVFKSLPVIAPVTPGGAVWPSPVA